MIQVGLIDGTDSRELRRRVLRPTFGPDDPLPGDELTDGVHVGAVDDGGTVVGTCYIYPDPCYWRSDGADAWRLRQMATAPGFQGQGIGGAVLATAVAYLEQRAVPIIWCHARAEAVRFYTRHGFHGHGDVFLDPQHPIPHLRMWRELPGAATSSG